MLKFILFLALNMNCAFASVSDGEKITKRTFDNSLFQVGDIKQSLLAENYFQSLHGDCWVLLDGRSIQNSELATNIGPTIPDGRGMFLRGKQNSRNDGKGNLVELSLGETQIKSNNNLFQLEYIPYQAHSSLVTVPEDSTWSSFMTLAASGSNNARPFRARNRGGESRPDNLTINHFIKINSNCQ